MIMANPNCALKYAARSMQLIEYKTFSKEDAERFRYIEEMKDKGYLVREKNFKTGPRSAPVYRKSVWVYRRNS